ncbi:IclR family transcriptional regulator domain-containing protein [Streptomyces canus]|uniref:IclR family transcriptional regulator domain-containing protein n=1 Tax=Streptomyces canus TaxID=58343 RepID=UPI0027D8910D|nr:IclR family transcriptional regulator C-terminal domain-containing protein [Streptomyces canus]
MRGWCSQSRVPAARCPQDTDLADHVPDTLKPLTPNTHTDHDALIKDLRATAERGYATDNEENFVGVVCYGFSLRFTTPPIDAISCSIPIDRLNPREDRGTHRGHAADPAVDRADGAHRPHDAVGRSPDGTATSRPVDIAVTLSSEKGPLRSIRTTPDQQDRPSG